MLHQHDDICFLQMGFEMLYCFSITVSFILKIAIKYSFSITIIAVLCVKKIFGAIPLHVSGNKLERNAYNARNVTRLRDRCSDFERGSKINKNHINKDTLFR